MGVSTARIQYQPDARVGSAVVVAVGVCAQAWVRRRAEVARGKSIVTGGCDLTKLFCAKAKRKEGIWGFYTVNMAIGRSEVQAVYKDVLVFHSSSSVTKSVKWDI